MSTTTDVQVRRVCYVGRDDDGIWVLIDHICRRGMIKAKAAHDESAKTPTLSDLMSVRSIAHSR